MGQPASRLPARYSPGWRIPNLRRFPAWSKTRPVTPLRGYRAASVRRARVAAPAAQAGPPTCRAGPSRVCRRRGPPCQHLRLASERRPDYQIRPLPRRASARYPAPRAYPQGSSGRAAVPRSARCHNQNNPPIHHETWAGAPLGRCDTVPECHQWPRGGQTLQ